MKQFLTKPSNFFLIVVTANMVWASPLSLITLLNRNREFGPGDSLREGRSFENTVPAGDTTPKTSVHHSRDYRKEWTKINQSPEGPITATVGSRIESLCEANGSPPPKILWLRENDPATQLTEFLGKNMAELGMSPNSWEGLGQVVSKLVIECVTPLDQGLIYCASVSGKKMQLSNPTLLLVNGATGNGSCNGENKPTITLHTPTRFALIGSSVVLPCRASGKPKPFMHWLDNKQAVIQSSSNPRYKLLSNGDLGINPLEWSDMGSFTCEAEADYKKDSVSTFLYPMLDEKKTL
uniref:Putative insulin/insulin-like peptide binding protein n=1 Tax=Eumenes pomiformis TaxID=693051 RepID=D1MEJ7_EUMPO|nr:putative insulin/insulin-like peptide binding protein [Eumenes pomiformis]